MKGILRGINGSAYGTFADIGTIVRDITQVIPVKYKDIRWTYNEYGSLHNMDSVNKFLREKSGSYME